MVFFEALIPHILHNLTKFRILFDWHRQLDTETSKPSYIWLVHWSPSFHRKVETWTKCCRIHWMSNMPFCKIWLPIQCVQSSSFIPQSTRRQRHSCFSSQPCRLFHLAKIFPLSKYLSKLTLSISQESSHLSLWSCWYSSSIRQRWACRMKNWSFLCLTQSFC